MNKKIIAVFGGSFNPPTVAHIELAKQVLKNIKDLDKIVFVPVSTKYNKKGLAPDEDRFNMLETICSNEDNLEVSRVELDSDRQLFTIETLQIIEESNPNSDIYFIIGTDNLKELPTWHNVERILQDYKIVVLERDEDSISDIIRDNKLLNCYKDSFITIKNINKINMSASNVRRNIAENKSIKGMVPKQIEKMVKKIYSI